MHDKIPGIAASLALLLCGANLCSAAAPAAPISTGISSAVIQVAPESSSLDFDSTNGTGAEREASTLVRIRVTGPVSSVLRPVEIFACVSGNEAMRAAGKRSALIASTLRIMNSQGEWVSMLPMPELEGRSGALVAVLSGTPATFRLRLRLELPRGQASGKYLGFITLEAHEQ
jgi:hypothetical protein